MRAPRDLMGTDLQPNDLIILEELWTFLDEHKHTMGIVTYNEEEDQFYLGDYPLNIYDKFHIIERAGKPM